MRLKKVMFIALFVQGGLSACGGGGGNSDAKIGNPTKLNDTGITHAGYTAMGVYVDSCSSAAAGNDCNTGRDASNFDNSDGPAGFSFTKIAADGSVLPVSAIEWSCIKDNVTGLVWENKTSANGSLTYTNYDNATLAQFWNGSIYINPTQAQIDATTNTVGYMHLVNARGLCGANDWRLPSVDELHGIVDYSVISPSIAASWFPHTYSGLYWSSSPSAGIDGSAWYVDFSYIDFDKVDRRSGLAVRLVRSEKFEVSNRYQISSDGQEVTDNETRLIWRRCVEGMIWDGGTCAGAATTYNHSSALSRAGSQARVSGKGWRLPNVKELTSIVDRSRAYPAIDRATFPAIPSRLFWSSTPRMTNSKYAWNISFDSGGVGYATRTNDLRVVRLVRSGR